MARFRKKPIEVEAVQWFPGVEIPGLEHVPGGHASDGSIWPDYAWVKTINGHPAKVRPGDWVITESDGVHHYPCTAEEFARIYEPA